MRPNDLSDELERLLRFGDTDRRSARLLGIRPAQGEATHRTQLGSTSPWLDGTESVNRLAEDLTRELGCPVEVMYLGDSREVVAVARPQVGRELRVVLPVSPIALPLMQNPFAALKCDLLNQRRRQMTQEPADG